jgi:hypothetical protein
MKQVNLFGDDFKDKSEKKYTNKIESPVYEPKYKKPHLLELYNIEKTRRLLAKINTSNVSDEEKQFLRIAAYRHNVFNYEKVADYYAQADPEMQDLMECSALVIIDFEKAIQNGYVKMCEEIRKQYLEEYGSE